MSYSAVIDNPTDEYIDNASADARFCPTTRFALDVVAKRVNAGKTLIQACERHLNDLRQSEDGWEYEFDRKKAQHVFDFFAKYACHSQGELAGQPIKLEGWQHFILGSLMGWVSKSTGNRRFTLNYTQIARKNGKSLLSSGLSLYMFMIDKEPGAQCYCASVKRDTAKIVWTDAMRMIRSSPALRKNVKIQESLGAMRYKNSVFKALSADKGQDGLNIHFCSIDEYHLFKTNDMFDVIVSGTQARRQPLVFIITTAGESRGGTSPCYNMYEYSKRILSGVIENDNMFIFIAEMDEGDAWDDPRAWQKANPNLDVSVKLEALKQAFMRARDNPGELANFQTKHLNMWLSRKDAYFPVDRWGDFQTPKLEGDQPAYIGVDLSSKHDLTAVSAVIPLIDGRYVIINRCFIPENRIDAKERLDKVPYRRWIREGWLTPTPGDVVDVEFIFKYITEELANQWKISLVACDPWNATALMTMLANEGFEVVEVRQGYKSLSEAIKFTHELMLTGKFIHGNNELLKWCTSNAVPKYDANENVVLDKSQSINRIDAIAATITAMTQAMMHFNNDNLDSHITGEWSIW